jgi:hypothetical protein
MTHRDEFLADYSLAGCFPAEPAAASSAAFILNQKTFVRKHFSANGNCSLIWLSHFAAQCSLQSVTYVSGPDKDNFGVPKGIRTPVIAVKGRCPRPG